MPLEIALPALAAAWMLARAATFPAPRFKRLPVPVRLKEDRR